VRIERNGERKPNQTAAENDDVAFFHDHDPSLARPFAASKAVAA
jgi:hypothetical protein